MALPLPALAFARMPDQSPTGTAISDLLHAIYLSWSSATDYRGTALPAANQWILAEKTTGVVDGVVATPPVGTAMTKAPAIIAAGRTVAAGTMAAPDAAVASVLQMGINKNSGVYADWTAPLPMTSGQWFGFLNPADAIMLPAVP